MNTGLRGIFLSGNNICESSDPLSISGYLATETENRKLRSGSAIQENVAGGGAQVRPQVQVLYFGFEILGKFP